MSTVVDALIVTLGLDPKDYVSGSNKARKSLKETGDEADRIAKGMEASGKQAAQFFSKLRNEALALLAIFTAGVGIKEFTQNTIGGAANLGLMSKNLGMSTESLTQWKLANEQAGGSAEGMIAQIKSASQAVTAFKNGQMEEGTKWAFFYGLKPEELKDSETYMMGMSRIVGDMYKKNPQQAWFQAQKMGISEDTFNFLKLGPAKMKEMSESQAENAVISAKQAEEALKLETRWKAHKRKMEATATTILLRLAPVMEKLLDLFQRFAAWVEAHKEDISQWIERAVVWIEEFAKKVDEAAKAIGGWKVVFEILLGLKILSMVGPLLSLAGSLFKVGKALAVIAGGSGLAALKVLGGLGLAGYAGWKAGGWINDQLSKETQEKGGKIIAKGLAALGNKSAQEAISANESADLFKSKEKQYGLPSGLLDSMWLQESGRGKNMLSPAGAKGHFQFMDATARQYGLKNPNDLAESADAAARMMRDLMRANGGDLKKSLAAYNWGQGNLNKKGLGSAPLETRNYMTQVAGRVASSTRQETNINGPIIIHTQATDAKGIAKEIGTELSGRMVFAAQTNTGLD